MKTRNKQLLNKKIGSGMIALFRFILFLLLAFVIIYPVFTKLMTAFMTAEDIHDLSVNYVPKHFTLSNFSGAWSRMTLSYVYPLSILYCGLISLLQMGISTMVGYGLARFKFPLQKPLLLMAVLGLLIPPDLTLIGLYGIFSNVDFFGIIQSVNGSSLSLINTFLPTTLLAVTGTGLRCGIYILLMRQFFRGMPKELEEAAYIDGAGPFKAFIKVMLPSGTTMMITVFLFSFVWTWLDTNYTSLLMPDIPVMSIMARRISDLNVGAGTLTTVTRSLTVNAAAIFVMIPLILLYLFTQHYFVESVERSGLVG